MAFPAANRDPEEFENPDEVNPRPRPQPPRRVRIRDPPLRRFQPRPDGAPRRDRRVARPYPRLPPRPRTSTSTWAGGQVRGPRVLPGRLSLSMPESHEIRVDPDKCQGHARCITIAPAALRGRRLRACRLSVGDGTVPPELEDAARLAIANCPEYAIEQIGTDALEKPELDGVSGSN